MNDVATQQQQQPFGDAATDSNVPPNNNNNKLPPPPRAADLQFSDDNAKRLYWDRSHYDSPASQMKALTTSATLYVGNLAFSTRVAHIQSHFSQLGQVKQIHMGLDRMRKIPCGFCFVEYYDRKDALAAVSLLSSTKLDGRVIRVELDAGFQPGRQYGRGKKGGQVRDDRKVDPSRKRQRMDTTTNTNTAAAASSSSSNVPPNDAAGGSGEAAASTGDAAQQEGAAVEEEESSGEPAAKRMRRS